MFSGQAGSSTLGHFTTFSWHGILCCQMSPTVAGAPGEGQGTNWYKEKDMGFGVRSLGCKAHFIAGLFVPQFPCFYKDNAICIGQLWRGNE